MKKDLIQYSIIALVALAALYIKNSFLSGIIFGASTMLLTFSIIGKILFKKSMTRIDKGVKDIIVANQSKP